MKCFMDQVNEGKGLNSLTPKVRLRTDLQDVLSMRGSSLFKEVTSDRPQWLPWALKEHDDTPLLKIATKRFCFADNEAPIQQRSLSTVFG